MAIFYKTIFALPFATILLLGIYSENIAQKIKGTYSQLVGLVKELQKCAVDDACILEGIASFETEAAHNMLNTQHQLKESPYGKMSSIWGMHTFQTLMPPSVYY